MNVLSIDKLNVLALILEQQDVTFADVESKFASTYTTQEVPSSEVYTTEERKELAWVFFENQMDLANMLADLLEEEAIELQHTSCLTYIKGQSLHYNVSVAYKLMHLINYDNWFPTVLRPGNNFTQEWERLTNDTSRKNKTKNRRKKRK